MIFLFHSLIVERYWDSRSSTDGSSRSCWQRWSYATRDSKDPILNRGSASTLIFYQSYLLLFFRLIGRIRSSGPYCDRWWRGDLLEFVNLPFFFLCSLSFIFSFLLLPSWKSSCLRRLRLFVLGELPTFYTIHSFNWNFLKWAKMYFFERFWYKPRKKKDAHTYIFYNDLRIQDTYCKY